MNTAMAFYLSFQIDHYYQLPTALSGVLQLLVLCEITLVVIAVQYGRCAIVND